MRREQLGGAEGSKTTSRHQRWLKLDWPEIDMLADAADSIVLQNTCRNRLRLACMLTAMARITDECEFYLDNG
jgi:hypothetical protein